MKDFLRQIKADFLLSSLLCILLGVVFIVWREATINAIGMIMAILLIIVGVVYIGSYFLKIVSHGISVVVGAVIVIIGIWILLQPSIIVSLIPIVIGVVLVAHGIRDLKESLDAKRYGYESWGVGIVLAVISIAFGVICIVDAFGVLEVASVLIGIALIYNGISNMWIASRVYKAAKRYAQEQGAIDVEFKD